MTRIKGLCKRLNVASVSYAPLKAGALVYEDGELFHIVINSALTNAKRTFALLHELGHLALGIIHKDPVGSHSINEELEVNLWAIDVFSELSPGINKHQLQSAFQNSEQTGYKEVEDQTKILNVKFEDLL